MANLSIQCKYGGFLNFLFKLGIPGGKTDGSKDRSNPNLTSVVFIT